MGSFSSARRVIARATLRHITLALATGSSPPTGSSHSTDLTPACQRPTPFKVESRQPCRILQTKPLFVNNIAPAIHDGCDIHRRHTRLITCQMHPQTQIVEKILAISNPYPPCRKLLRAKHAFFSTLVSKRVYPLPLPRPFPDRPARPARLPAHFARSPRLSSRPRSRHCNLQPNSNESSNNRHGDRRHCVTCGATLRAATVRFAASPSPARSTLCQLACESTPSRDRRQVVRAPAPRAPQAVRRCCFRRC